MNSLSKLLLARARTIKPGEAVPSPCMSVCRMDGVSGLCEGCFRTLDEIAAWGTMDDATRRATWKRIEHRVAA